MSKSALLLGLLVLSATQPARATTGGDATLTMLGWDDSHSTVFALLQPGGENSRLELMAFNFNARRVDVAGCDSCAELLPTDRGRDAEERIFLRVLRRASRLPRPQELPRASWEAAGIQLACVSTQPVTEDGKYRRQRCVLSSRDRPKTTFAFSAPSEWYRARIFMVPDQPGVALCWVAHTGIYESGYREHELATLPDLPRYSVSLSELARRYLS